MDSVGLEATQEGNTGWGFLIRIYGYIFFLSGCDLRSCFAQWTGLFQTHNTAKRSQRAWSHPETSGCKSGRSSWAEPPKRDLPLILQVSSVSFLSFFFCCCWRNIHKKNSAFPQLSIDEDSATSCKKCLICYGLIFFLLFENIQPSGKQTNKMLPDIGSKAYTEKQLVGEGNGSQPLCSLMGFDFVLFFPLSGRLLSWICICKKQNLVMIFI